MTNEEFQKIVLEKFSSVEDKLSSIESQIKENTQILRALEHSAEVNKAEYDKIANDIAYIKGDISGLRKDIANVEIITSSNWNDIAKLKAIK